MSPFCTFPAKKYKKVTGKEIYSDTLESTPMLEKEKFPQDYFPEVCPGRRPPGALTPQSMRLGNEETELKAPCSREGGSHSGCCVLQQVVFLGGSQAHVGPSGWCLVGAEDLRHLSLHESHFLTSFPGRVTFPMRGRKIIVSSLWGLERPGAPQQVLDGSRWIWPRCWGARACLPWEGWAGPLASHR